MAYDGATHIATLTMYQVTGNVLSLLETELVPLDLDQFGSGYDTGNGFLVDSLSIMTYRDGFTTAEDPSLVADVTFYQLALSVPEPSSFVLAGLAGLATLALVRSRRAVPVRH